MAPRPAANKKGPRAQMRKKAGTAPLKKKAVMDETDVSAFLEDLDVELQSRCRVILFEAQRQADSVQSACSSELIKLPKNIRAMSVREFCEKYGGQISLVLEQDRKRVLESAGIGSNGVLSPSTLVLQSAKAVQRSMSMRKAARGPGPRFGVPGSALSLRNRAALGAHNSAAKRSADPLSTPMRGAGGAGGVCELANIFATPKYDPSVLQTPATAVAGSRTARPMRRGESIMSVNGSPLVAADTPGSKPRPRPAYTEAGGFSLPFEPQSFDSLVSQISSDKDKDKAVSQLEAINREVARLMETINSGDNKDGTHALTAASQAALATAAASASTPTSSTIG